MQTALFILGMHRSGTSALTRVVNLLGADLSDKLMPPASDNERGFWEQDEIVPIHEALLGALHASWCDANFLPDEFEKTPLCASFTKQLEDVVALRFSGSNLWALKDPRLSILLPIWKPILKKPTIKPVYLLALRHPLEVASSLEKRDQMPIAHGCAVWLHYTLRALTHTEHENRLIISYDSLLDDWKNIAHLIASAMGQNWPHAIEAKAADIDAFLSKDLRHHSASTQHESDAYFVKTAIELYHLVKLSDGKNAVDMDAVRTVSTSFALITEPLRFSTAHANHRVLIAEHHLRMQREKNHGMEQMLIRLQAEVADLMKQHHELWSQAQEKEVRLNASPLRALFSLFSNRKNP